MWAVTELRNPSGSGSHKAKLCLQRAISLYTGKSTVPSATAAWFDRYFTEWRSHTYSYQQFLLAKDEDLCAASTCALSLQVLADRAVPNTSQDCKSCLSSFKPCFRLSFFWKSTENSGFQYLEMQQSVLSLWPCKLNFYLTFPVLTRKVLRWQSMCV